MQNLTGMINLVAENFAPRGQEYTNGQTLPIAENTALFSLLGTIYGGDGITTFGLPDLRGRVPIHQGQGPGLSRYNNGEKGGVEQVTLIESQLPAHNHLPRGIDTKGGSPNPKNGFFSASDDDVFSTESDVNMGATTSTGGGQSHENRMPYLGLNYIICIAGIYPSRS